MKTVGVVISVCELYSVVESERMSACEGCHKSAEGCSVCSLMGGKSRKISTRAVNDIGAEVGDRVEIESDSGRVLGYAFVVFVLSILFMLCAFFVSSALELGGIFTYVSPALGFALGMAVAFVYSRVCASRRADARIVAIVKKSDAE